MVDEADNKSLKVLLVILIVATISFMLFITPIIIKSNNGGYCEVLTQKNSYLQTITTSNIILDANNDYFFNNHYDSDEKLNDLITKKEYCFLATNNGSKILDLEIIDEDQEVINKAYLLTGSHSVCSEISTDNYFVGLKCLNCDTDNALLMNKISLSDDEVINFNGELIAANSLSDSTKTFISCNNMIKNYLVTYLILVALLLFSMGIVVSISGFGGLVFGKW